jgi:hypothetical protein
VHLIGFIQFYSGLYLVQNSQSAWALEIKTRLWNTCTKIRRRVWRRSKRPRILLYQWKTRLTRTKKQSLVLVLAIEHFVQPRLMKTGSTDKKTVKNMTKLLSCLGRVSSSWIDGIRLSSVKSKPGHYMEGSVQPSSESHVDAFQTDQNSTSTHFKLQVRLPYKFTVVYISPHAFIAFSMSRIFNCCLLG